MTMHGEGEGWVAIMCCLFRIGKKSQSTRIQGADAWKFKGIVYLREKGVEHIENNQVV
jgi:hypothetical protein